MNTKRTKADLYMQDRMSGMTHAEIAKKYGVSHQAVQQACARYTPGHFRAVSEDGCVYPILRRWLNENLISVSELCRRMDLLPLPGTRARICEYLRGKRYPTKKTIDQLLAATGLTYEQMFAEGEK